jgi:hypothetical protein
MAIGDHDRGRFTGAIVGSLRLDVGGADHFASLLGFLGEAGRTLDDEA